MLILSLSSNPRTASSLLIMVTLFRTQINHQNFKKVLEKLKKLKKNSKKLIKTSKKLIKILNQIDF